MSTRPDATLAINHQIGPGGLRLVQGRRRTSNLFFQTEISQATVLTEGAESPVDTDDAS